MRVKIGNRWYEPRRGRPIMIVLSDDDKKDMAPMFDPDDGQEKFAVFVHGDPAFPSTEAQRAWMDE